MLFIVLFNLVKCRLIVCILYFSQSVNYSFKNFSRFWRDCPVWFCQSIKLQFHSKCVASSTKSCRSPLSSVHTSNNVEATLSNATGRTILSTMSNVASTLLPFLATMSPVSATMSNAISSFRQSRNKYWTCSVCFDSVEMTKFYDKLVKHCCRFGNKVECCFDKDERCFDIVASVDGALGVYNSAGILLVSLNKRLSYRRETRATLLYQLKCCPTVLYE